MIIRNSFAAAVAAAITAVFLSVAIQPAKAAVINWGTAQNISGPSDVITTGTLFASANFFQTTGSGSGNVAVNGVTFNGFQVPIQTPASGPTTLTVGNITLTGTSNQPSYVNLQGFTALGGPASYNGLLNQIGYLYNTTTAPTLNVGISGLTNGAQYLIQYWVNDSRGTTGTRFRTTVVGGQTLAVNATTLAGGFGQYITGTFTADSSTQSFSAVGGTGGVAYANAMQVRLLAIPEPSTWAMAAVGLVCAVTGGEIRRRRRVR